MDNEPTLILASGSPRRKELLEAAGFDFRVQASDAEENAPGDLVPKEAAIYNAAVKAHAVASCAPQNAIIIGADTIVVLDGCIFGKPADEAEACRMLQQLSGHTHQVITGVCIIESGAERSFAEITDVTFRDLDRTEIETYVASGEPLDKAGAYGIQGKGGNLVDHIEGDYENVVGLPVTRLQEELSRSNV